MIVKIEMNIEAIREAQRRIEIKRAVAKMSEGANELRARLAKALEAFRELAEHTKNIEEDETDGML